VLAVRKRVEAVGDPDLTDAQRRWRCVMEVRLKDGRVLKHQTMAAKGSFENPLTREEEEEKALDLVVPVLGRKRARDLLDALWSFDQLKDVRALRRLYSK
jgi:2-methylcitrate dehydratase PrpD